MSSPVTLDTIVSFCKRRGFVYPSAEIYGGINGVYDFGPMGVLLRNNLRQEWLAAMKESKYDFVQLDGAQLGPESMWQASGHLDNFSDPMVDCQNCKKRFRPDEDNINLEKPCPSCGVQKWTDIRQFQMMFKTELGAPSQSASSAYLRPETAQAIFVNFKNVMSTSRVKMPFGIAQIGKAFRNEITPKQFLFRMREFEQMEMEFFCKEAESNDLLAYWITMRSEFYTKIGINPEKLRMRTHESSELAHYAEATVDFEYHFPFGWKELEGVAHRSNYDLTQHTKHSGKDLSVFDDATKESYIPTVIECSVGLDRLFLVALCDSYTEDEIDGEKRTVLKLHPSIAPIKAAVLPLSKKLSEPAIKIKQDLAKIGIETQFDASGSIGKRYRRQDEIGTPLCITYDFDSETDHAVTVRNRDTTTQERIGLDKLKDYVTSALLLCTIFFGGISLQAGIPTRETRGLYDLSDQWVQSSTHQADISHQICHKLNLQPNQKIMVTQKVLSNRNLDYYKKIWIAFEVAQHFQNSHHTQHIQPIFDSLEEHTENLCEVVPFLYENPQYSNLGTYIYPQFDKYVDYSDGEYDSFDEDDE